MAFTKVHPEPPKREFQGPNIVTHFYSLQNPCNWPVTVKYKNWKVREGNGLQLGVELAGNILVIRQKMCRVKRDVGRWGRISVVA
jgi:hypothetical protein